MNKHPFLAIAASSIFVFHHGLAQATEPDPNAAYFMKLYDSLCVKNIRNLETLRGYLAKNNAPKLPADKAAPFLSGGEGDVWPVPSQGKFGNFLLALPKGKSLCTVFARRARQSEVEKSFGEFTWEPPVPLVMEKKSDKETNTPANGKTHTVSYTWSEASSPVKILLTLTTSATEDAQLQAMASVALVKD